MAGGIDAYTKIVTHFEGTGTTVTNSASGNLMGRLADYYQNI